MEEFSIGRPVPRQRLRQRARPPSMRWPQLKLKAEPHSIPNRFMLLVPDDWILLYLLNDISSKYGYIQGLKELTKESKFQILQFRSRRVLMVPPGTETTFLAKAIDHFKQNYKLVITFRKLLYRWQGRRFKICNEEDLHTCEPPKKLITLRVNSEKTLYQFEATTILRDMVQRLLSQGYLFPKYLMPRNPFTNCEMSLAQFYSIVMQLRKAGHSHWVLEGLVSVRYDIEQFKVRFGASVRKHIILTEFKNPSADTLDLVHNFIEIQYEKNLEEFNAGLYMWALEHHLHHSRIKAWMNLCKDYYIMVYTDGDGKEYMKELLNITTLAKRLCRHESDDLNTLYSEYLISIGDIDAPDIDIAIFAYLDIDLFL